MKILTILLSGLILVSCIPPKKFQRGNNRDNYTSKRYNPRSYNRSRNNSYRSRNSNGNNITRSAKRYLGTRYRFGGTTPKGFDCSGFTYYVYRLNGINLPRSASDQFYKGRRISFRRLKPGDLVFFNTSRRKRISHVGIYMGNKKFIHAPRSGKTVSYADVNNSYWRKRIIGFVTYL